MSEKASNLVPDTHGPGLDEIIVRHPANRRAAQMPGGENGSSLGKPCVARRSVAIAIVSHRSVTHSSDHPDHPDLVLSFLPPDPRIGLPMQWPARGASSEECCAASPLKRMMRL